MNIYKRQKNMVFSNLSCELNGTLSMTDAEFESLLSGRK